MTGRVVDCILDLNAFQVPYADLSAQVLEPMIARLKRNFEIRGDAKYIQMRITAFDVTGKEFQLLASITDEDES